MNLELKHLHLEDRPFELDQHGPIFILGCPRSGTTFLSKCLATINEVEEFTGVLVPPRFMHLIASTEDTVLKENMLMTTRDIFWQAFWRRRYYKDQRLIQILRRNAPINSIFKKSDLTNAFFCYKEPFLCFAATDFAKHYPNAKFIHIIRDGRDNADSMDRTYPYALSDEVLKNESLTKNNVSEIGIWRRYRGFSIPWWVNGGDENLFIDSSKYERNLYMWKHMVSEGRKLNKLVENKRYFELKYEDFVTQPISMSLQLIDFLGVDLNSRMKKQLQKAFSTSVGISKNRSSKKVKGVESIAYDLLSELGYIR